MSSNKFDALVVSDDSDNSDGNMGDSGNLTGKNNRKVYIISKRTSVNFIHFLNLIS